MNRHLFEQPVYPLLDLEAAERAGRDPFSIVADWRSRALFCFQLRAKQLTERAYLGLSEQLARRFPDVRIIANDFVALALSRRELFHGIHLGQEDWHDLAETLRAMLRAATVESRERGGGPEFITGFSTHTAGQLAAALKGVDPELAQYPAWSYIALGPMVATLSKRNGLWPVLTPEELRRCSEIYSDFFERAGKFGPSRGPFRPRLVCIGGLNGHTLVEGLRNLTVPDLAPIPIPAMIQAALGLDSLDDIIKNVALLAREKTLET